MNALPFDQLFSFIGSDPMLRLAQGSLVSLGVFAVFLVCYTTKDILLRTHSFFYQFFSILLVAFLPVLGFLLYLLIRPASTIRQRETQERIEEIFTMLAERTFLAEEMKSESEPRPSKESEPAAVVPSATLLSSTLLP